MLDVDEDVDVDVDFEEVAVHDEHPQDGSSTSARASAAAAPATRDSTIRSPPLSRTRSLSDGGTTPILSPAPYIYQSARPESKDDIGIRDKESESERERERERGRDRDRDRDVVSSVPSTPVRAGFPLRGLSLQLPQRNAISPAHPSSSNVKPAPLSPKLDHSQSYASPTNILPRRSRGLDFSRAATSLHHSTLADQASPDSSPTIGSRAMNIPGRRNGDYGNTEQTSTSLWSIMGNQERMHISSSLGSNTHICSDTSSSSEDDDMMDEDMDEAYVTTPQPAKMGTPSMMHQGAPWIPGGGSPAVNSLLSFQQRQRQRKHQTNRKKMRANPLGFGFNSSTSANPMSRSPPGNMASKDSPHARRESISWAANQLHISGSESDETSNRYHDGVDSPSRPSVIRRPVTRRGNLLPKTKGFARIRAALAEESAPVEAEFRREAEVVKQVRESDVEIELRPPPSHSAATTALSSPNLAGQDNLDDVPEDAMMIDSAMGGPAAPSGLGLTGSFKRQALKNSKGKVFWELFSESSINTPPHLTPPPPSFGVTRGSTSASSQSFNLEDVNMDSPSASSTTTTSQQNPFVLPGGEQTTTSSSGNGTPQPPASHGSSGSGSGAVPPTAAEITRRINTKRRRDDDFDPVSFKRRAVSPGMSAHNSPVMQSPLQRDAPWGGGGSGAAGNLRPGSVGSDTAKPSSENGSGGGNRVSGGKGRVGFQVMVDTNDGITRLSIE
ncbi:hypothetical protein B0T22DRAFT_484501 [Podospora appendiculata]|uniref:Uncharacterized protein n=1 Tax=Podospora appendiculata TaxID=314037 RepID=A0AAE0X0R3_9PEZI|nr:hypothetical protein B0T22DRAFT_484501 [Podospora appendiculata]